MLFENGIMHRDQISIARCKARKVVYSELTEPAFSQSCTDTVKCRAVSGSKVQCQYAAARDPIMA